MPKVEKLCLGTVQFGQNYGINNTVGLLGDVEIFEIFDYADQKGIKQLDTADAYGNALDVIGLDMHNRMRKIAIIPARGGSKRIPRKNIKDFLGKPIIAYSIEAARKSGLFDDIIVSTDDSEIAEISKNYGASIPFFRSNRNSSDYATTLDVFNEVIAQCKSIGKDYDFACIIYPTAPLVTKEHLIQGFSVLSKESKDSVFPVAQFSSPIWRGLRISDQNIEMIWPENMNVRTQDLEKTFFDAGQWYWINVKNYKNSIWTKKSGAVILESFEVQDIDNEEDWILAELKYKYLCR